MRPLWYRNAVIYQIDPSLFRDSNGDGCGDLRGITASKPTRGPVTQRNADRQQRGDDQQLPCQRLPPEPPRQWYPQQ